MKPHDVPNTSAPPAGLESGADDRPDDHAGDRADDDGPELVEAELLGEETIAPVTMTTDAESDVADPLAHDPLAILAPPTTSTPLPDLTPNNLDGAALDGPAKPSDGMSADDALHAPIGAGDDDVIEHTVERPLSGAPIAVVADSAHVVAEGAVEGAGDDDFENQKTTELSALLVPVPVSMGPRAPILDGIDLPRRDTFDMTAEIPLRALQSLPQSLAPPEVAYEDPPTVPPPVAPFMPPPLDFPDGGVLPAHLDEKTADIVIHRPMATAGSDDGSHVSTDEGATMEGAPLDEQRTDQGAAPPNAGDVLTADDGTRVSLEESLGEQAGMVFFKARLSKDGVDQNQAFTAVWMAQAPAEPPWDRLPDNRLVRPRCRVSLEKSAAVRVFERPKGNTVVDYLADDDKLLPAMGTIELGLELAELLESLHGAGCCIYDLDPSQIVIEQGGRVRLYAVSGIYPQGTLPHGALGAFCAPEVRRRMSYRVSAAADVYAVALLLYALLARRAPLDIDTDPSFLVSPRVFRSEVPLGLWPSLRPCLDGNPLRRTAHARGLRQHLETARARLLKEMRATEEQTPVMLEGWAEQHAGLTKARRGSGQQDRSLSVTDETGRIGLYVISDGVSRSKFGDGAFAAEQVEVSSLQRWSGLEKAGPQALALEHQQRADILKQIARSAGKRIAAEINANYAPIPNEPNQVMSATLVTAFINNGDCTLGNLGDSRAYLIRDGTIEQISIDHDRCTDALRLGLSFREAAHIQMGSALTRVVGRVIIDDSGSCRPDPFEPEIFRFRLLPGDRLLLCSDGVADFAAGAGLPPAEQDARMLQCVLEYEDPARAAFELVVLANRAGGYDNISCVVIAVHSG